MAVNVLLEWHEPQRASFQGLDADHQAHRHKRVAASDCNTNIQTTKIAALSL
jgi:hypothetical protein